jgi:hypothetical protein
MTNEERDEILKALELVISSPYIDRIDMKYCSIYKVGKITRIDVKATNK